MIVDEENSRILRLKLSFYGTQYGIFAPTKNCPGWGNWLIKLLSLYYLNEWLIGSRSLAWQCWHSKYSPSSRKPIESIWSAPEVQYGQDCPYSQPPTTFAISSESSLILSNVIVLSSFLLCPYSSLTGRILLWKLSQGAQQQSNKQSNGKVLLFARSLQKITEAYRSCRRTFRPCSEHRSLCRTWVPLQPELMQQALHPKPLLS